MKENVLEDIVEILVNEDIDRDSVDNVKYQVCSEYSANEVPSNNEILNHASEKEREDIRDVLQVSPVRSSSGVSPVTIMTHPQNVCPHGRCFFCPAGKDSQFPNTQISYPGGPSVMRAQDEDYDPYGQTMRRISQLHYNGHNVDKIELIIKSSTITSRSHDYQQWFVKRALQAMNDYNPDSPPENIEKDTFSEDDPSFEYLNKVKKRNETGDVRCIGITFETKPDWCGIEQIDRMLNLGVTKTEIGVQTTYDEINEKMHRGHGSKESARANKILRDSGMKVGFHMMPGMPGMSKDMILNDFERIFNKEKWKPDYLKIYPTLVVPGTRVYDMWRKGDFDPLESEEAAEIIADIKEIIPEYVRLQRVQRDIPADQIEAGVQKSNLRQIARKRMDGNCDCIRCREVGLSDKDFEGDEEMNEMDYYACDGKEIFVSIEDSNNNLVGFVRLRIPDSPHREELKDSLIVRDLHVYGNQIPIGKESEAFQHTGYGTSLMERAEEIAIERGMSKVSVISGIGARQFYKRKLNYVQDGPYVSKEL
jgi:elongator complex protein 3